MDVLKTGGSAHSSLAKEAVSEPHLIFNASEEELSRFKKAFIGEVDNPDLTYSLQDIFHSAGYFSVEVTHLGANLCLVEDVVEGEVKDLMEDGGAG